MIQRFQPVKDSLNSQIHLFELSELLGIWTNPQI